ncbi:hypothetical protein HU200_057923 [Digitaria exilis]|uniref:Uncharacterized protein n=1 Tax=Digitaria exilis TaxID=1010633 RepID=A0A835AKG6_9POAL|nr:hypothetical protein HU200_057923 [Digitaria exilis]
MVVDVLKETLDTIRLPPSPEKLLTAADLGCSCGENTLFVADVIVDHMSHTYTSIGHAPPEFSFYFSDLPSNDFNTLFRLLPDQQQPTAAGRTGDHRRRRYFAAGVPGSLYDRLFPENSINAFTSTFSVHWLSQVPREVMDETSNAYNKGKVFVHGASEATGAAYKRQFQSDLTRFLRRRAAELKHGGVVFLLCLGRPATADPTDQGRVRLLYGTLFEDSWSDLVTEVSTHWGTYGLDTMIYGAYPWMLLQGVMEQKKMDSFNVPLYAPTLEEVREAVDDAGGAFRINRLEMVMGSPPVVVDAGADDDDPAAVGRTVANNVRSFVGALVDAHVGKAMADELFDRLRRRAEGQARELMAELRLPHVVCSLSLA